MAKFDTFRDISKNVFSYFKKFRKLVSDVKIAGDAIDVDVEVKMEYVMKMLKRLSKTYNIVDKNLNKIISLDLSDENNKKTVVSTLLAIQKTCLDVFRYEKSLAGADLTLFEKHKDHLLKGNKNSFKAAYKFYIAFECLLTQSRVPLNAMAQSIKEQPEDLEFTIERLENVAEAYMEFMEGIL